MKKMLVSNYDDIYYRDTKEIKKNIKQSEEFRENGNVFVITTDGTYANFSRIFKTNKFKYDYLIINHGSTVLDGNNNIISNYTIDNNAKQQIYNILKESEYEAMFACNKLKTVEVEEENITKIGVVFRDKDDAYSMNEYINNKFNTYVTSYYIPNKNMIEIIPIDTDKEKSINNISKMEKVDNKNIYETEGSYNDIKMVKQFNSGKKGM